MRVVTNFGTEFFEHRLIGIRHKKHRMRHSGIKRVDGLRTSRAWHLLIEPQIARFRQTHSDSLPIELSVDYPRARLEGKIAVKPSALLHETRKAPRAIAAHFARATVAVVKLPRAIS